jgi:hypothetical protein
VPPLKSFASLIYLAVGGRQVRPQALFSSAACIPIPGLSSNGNRTLAASLSGEGGPSNCRALLDSLLKDEAISADVTMRHARQFTQPAAAATTATTQRTTAALTGSQITAALAAIDAAARHAKESSEQALRIRLPKGADDSVLSRHQLEALKRAKEASAASLEAKDLAATDKLDHAGLERLSVTAADAAAAVARELAHARAVASDQESETRGAQTGGNRTATQPPPVEEPVVRLQPAVTPAPVAVEPKKGRSPVAAIVIFFLLAAGAGGWFAYDRGWLPFLTKADPPKQNGPEKTGNGNVVDEPPDPPVQPKDPEPPPPPPTPQFREMVVAFSGDVPDSDDVVSFSGTDEKPKVSRKKDGGLEFTFTLKLDAPNPQPVVSDKRLSMTPLRESKERSEFQLTRLPPPDTVRLTGLTARDPLSVTIDGKPGTPAGSDLVFSSAAESDGSFRLDCPSWRVKGRPVYLKGGTWQAEVELVIRSVQLRIPDELSWSAVVFIPVNPKTLPDLKPMADQLGARAVSDEDIEFRIDPGEPERTLLVPAGDYTLKWKSRNLATPQRDGGRFTVDPDKANSLSIPE